MQVAFTLNLTAVVLLALSIVGRRNGDGPDVVSRRGRFVAIIVANLLL